MKLSDFPFSDMSEADPGKGKGVLLIRITFPARLRARSFRVLFPNRRGWRRRTVREALALWEERERALAEFRATLDEAKDSLARGEGTKITRQSMRELTDSIIERTRARLAAEPNACG